VLKMKWSVEVDPWTDKVNWTDQQIKLRTFFLYLLSSFTFLNFRASL
jgi:hypothetical protein